MELGLEGEKTRQHQTYTQRLAEVLMNLVSNVYDHSFTLLSDTKLTNQVKIIRRIATGQSFYVDIAAILFIF